MSMFSASQAKRARDLINLRNLRNLRNLWINLRILYRLDRRIILGYDVFSEVKNGV
jgi:hypothetical protein